MGSTETAFNTHPQPRTFAPSKEDVLQVRLPPQFHTRAHASAPLTRRPRSPCAEPAVFLRSASEPREAQGLRTLSRTEPSNRCQLLLTRCLLVRAQSEHHAVTYHFPDAYAGSNVSATPELTIAVPSLTACYLLCDRPRSVTSSTT